MRIPLLTRAAAAGVSIALFPAPATAQTIDEIIARHITARGGMERIKAVQTLKITRTVATGIGTTLRVIVYRKRPNLYRLEQGPAQGSTPLVPRGINPDAAWDTAQGKIVTRSEQAAAEARELDGDFDGFLVDWRDKGNTVVYEGRVPLTGGDAHAVKVTTKSGVVRTVYLDAVTYLDRRHTGVLTLPGGRKFDVSIDFGNWQEVSGVKFPFDITEERTGGGPVQTFVTYTDAIEANVPLEDALFAPPGSRSPE